MPSVPLAPPTPTGGDPRRRVAVATLGCKVNAFESELIAESFVRRSWDRVGVDDAPDVIVVNTCTVTREADRQARQLVRRAVRRNPGARVVVTGCYAEMDPAAVAAIPGVDLVLGNRDKLEVAALLPRLEAGELPPVRVTPREAPSGPHPAAAPSPSPFLSDGFGSRSRAFVHVQQGCDQGCTFCIIHRARGPSRSHAAGAILEQIRRLVDGGFREVVLCGVDLGDFGAPGAAGDVPGAALARLLEEIDALPGDFRVRLSSLDPHHLSPPVLERLSAPRLCPHLHLSVQSASTLILKRMKRRYVREDVYERVGAARELVPGLVVTADLMAGFPTETEVQFEQTLKAVRDLEIAFAHVFAYSEREGTPAARIPTARQVPVPERRRRAAALREASSRVARRLAGERVGRRLRVIPERRDERRAGHVVGRADDYVPVALPAAGAVIGEWQLVEGVRAEGEMVVARAR